MDRTFPNGRVLGIDIIPALPPKGVSTIQGNFLSQSVQEEVKKFLRESDRGRSKETLSLILDDGKNQITQEDLEQSSRSYLELEKRADSGTAVRETIGGNLAVDELEGKLVDVILSDMSEPWAQTEGFWKRSLSDPYYRMMNTSGVSFKDHAGSMVNRYCDLMKEKYTDGNILQDLCDAALHFAFDTLRKGGHFVCKFYQGSEDKTLEYRLKRLFSKVYREKPESSRSVRPSSC